jgi:hypothetical protein
MDTPTRNDNQNRSLYHDDYRRQPGFDYFWGLDKANSGIQRGEQGRFTPSSGRRTSKTCQRSLLLARKTLTYLLQSILPVDHVRGDTVLSVVHQDDHTLGVHRLSNEELVVLEVSDQLLGEGLSGSLESREPCLGGLVSGLGSLSEGRLELLHVALQVGQVGLLVERGRGESERVDNVVDGLATVLEGFLLLFGGRVGADVDVTFGDDHHLGVDFVGDVIDFLAAGDGWG